jgi:hypothetical protein
MYHPKSFMFITTPTDMNRAIVKFRDTWTGRGTKEIIVCASDNPVTIPSRAAAEVDNHDFLLITHFLLSVCKTRVLVEWDRDGDGVGIRKN